MTTWGSEQGGLRPLGCQAGKSEIKGLVPRPAKSPLAQCSETTCGGFHQHRRRERRALGRLERQMGCRRALGHSGLGAQLLLLSSCWHGHEKLSPLGNCAPGKPVLLLGLSLLIYEMSRLDQMIFAVSLGPDKPKFMTCGHHDSADGIVVDGRGAAGA